jgi:hypothetical protein
MNNHGNQITNATNAPHKKRWTKALCSMEVPDLSAWDFDVVVSDS